MKAGLWAFLIAVAVMLVLKLTGVIDLPWALVLMPVWFPIAVLVIFTFILLLLKLIEEML